MRCPGDPLLIRRNGCKEARPEKVRPRGDKIAAIARAGLPGLTGSSFAASLAFGTLMDDHAQPTAGI
jgi:hypothetical protein